MLLKGKTLEDDFEKLRSFKAKRFTSWGVYCPQRRLPKVTQFQCKKIFFKWWPQRCTYNKTIQTAKTEEYKSAKSRFEETEFICIILFKNTSTKNQAVFSLSCRGWLPHKSKWNAYIFVETTAFWFGCSRSMIECFASESSTKSHREVNFQCSWEFLWNGTSLIGWRIQLFYTWLFLTHCEKPHLKLEIKNLHNRQTCKIR